ncbi:hypothetical protein JZ751_013456 [Albula glossodonta]|uniref:non-specific serine/threonine protein kinase n=1 Tax=Albula glossodonta TaxID=121402 RepID=A0A8T2MT15_9TELE|nr:hypothetical protein JZ751_013456 [Albula glossodonta]
MQDQEDPEDYCYGGYHPVQIGDTFNRRYQVLKKLGWGYFSTVWLCLDLRLGRQVAVKVLKSGANFTQAAQDELALLRCVTLTATALLTPTALTATAPTDRYSTANSYSADRYSTVNSYSTDRYSTGNSYSTDHYSTANSYSTDRYSTANSYSTDRYSTANSYSTDHYSTVNSYSTDHYSTANSYRTDHYSTANSYSTDRYSTVNSYSTDRYSTINSYSTDLYSTANSYSADLYSTANSYSTDLYSTANSYSTDLYSTANSYSTDRYSTANSYNMCLVLELLGPDLHSWQDCFGNPGLSLPWVKQVIQQPENILMCIGNQSQSQTLEGATCIQLPGKEVRYKTCGAPERNLMTPFSTERVSVKIADLGSSCWVYKHFSEEIQTRQYRSLEAFELVTGEPLFEPKGGKTFSVEEDHLAHIIELLGEIPISVALSGKYSDYYFNHKGDLRRIRVLRPWGLYEVLVEKYHCGLKEASLFSDFLLHMLDFLPERRATAAQCLSHPWISS